MKRFLLVLAPGLLLSACGEPKPDVTVDAGNPLAVASDTGTTAAIDSAAPSPAPSAPTP